MQKGGKAASHLRITYARIVRYRALRVILIRSCAVVTFVSLRRGWDFCPFDCRQVELELEKLILREKKAIYQCRGAISECDTSSKYSMTRSLG
jgi:hypothetical protein